jgi:hypothetical protein
MSNDESDHELPDEQAARAATDLGWTCTVKEVHLIRVEVKGRGKALWNIDCRADQVHTTTIDGSLFVRINGREKGVATALAVIAAADGPEGCPSDRHGNKSFAYSPGLQRLKDLRNEAQRNALLPVSSLAFRGAQDQPAQVPVHDGDEAETSTAPSWKRQKVSESETDSLQFALSLSVGKFNICVGRPLQKNSPLLIKADATNIRAFLAAMIDFGVSFERRAPKAAADDADETDGTADAARSDAARDASAEPEHG